MAQRRSHLAVILQINLKALNRQEDRSEGTEAQFKKVTRVGMGSAHRLLKGPNGQNITLSTLQQIADGFHMEAWELLMPGLDPHKRPKIRFDELQQEVEILRQQLHDIRVAINGNSAAPGPGGGSADPGRAGNHTADRQTQGHKPKGD